MKILRLCGVLLGLVLALVSLSSPAMATTPVHLSGTVTNTDGVPQNGYVYVQKVGANSASGVGLSNGTFSWDWNTDQNPEGDYLIYVRSTTMDDLQRWYVAGDPAGSGQQNQATPVHLGPGAPDVNIAMVLPAIAKVSGRVVGTDKAGVAGLSVSINEGGTVRSTTSGVGGAFDLGYVRAGSWKVYVNGTDFLTAQADVTVPASGTVVMPDIVIREAASISGQVTDSVTGDPIPFVQVVAYNSTTHVQIGQPANTGADGRYRIGDLGSTSFVLRFYDAADNLHGYAWALNDGGDPNDFSPQTPITLGEGEQRTYGQQLVLKEASTPPTHTLSGTVTDLGGRPLVGIDVTNGDLEATTDRRGQWYLDAPTGQHTLRLTANDRWLQVFGSAPSWFPTTATTSGTIDVSLRRAGRINGTLLAASGAEVGNRELWLYDGYGTLLAQETGNDGDGFQLEAPAGVQVYLLARAVTADPPVTDLLPRWYGDVDARAAATPIQVGPGETVTGKDIHLASGLANQTAPVVSGLRAVGKTLTASTGTWSTMTMTAFATTWWRGSTQVGSGASYVVKPADAGRALRAKVIATNGSVTGTAFSAPVGIGKLASTATLKGSSPNAGKVRLVVTVRAAGLTPTGTVVIRRGSRIVKKVNLTGGKATVVLSQQPKGVQRYQVSYPGSAQVLPDSSPVLRLRVR